MACPRCGATSPETSAGGLCNYCRYKMAEEDAAKNREAQKAREAKEKRNTPSAPMDPTVAKIICIILAIALLVGACWWVISSYNNKSAKMTMQVLT